MEARAIWHNKKESWIGPVDSLSKSELLIQSIYSLVSQGTEQTMITKIIPEEVIENMAVPYMLGDLNDQFTYGYSLVGRVVDGPNDLKDQVVHLMHPHQDYVTANSADVVVLPNDIDPKEATLASNLETAVNAIWDSEIQLGDCVMIAGYGLIGSLLATLIQRMPGITCEILESDNDRIELLHKHGHQIYKQNKSNRGIDIVFNTTGSGEVLQEALKLTSQEGKIIELSWYGPGITKLELGTDFHYGRKRIISSQVSNIPLQKQGKWDYHRRKELVFNLLSTIDFSHLTDRVIQFEESPQFFRELREGSVRNISTIIQY